MDNERRRYKRYLLEDGENLMPRTTALRRRRQHEVELETDSESDHDHQDDAPVAEQLLDFVQNQDVFSDQDSDAHAHRRADSDPESVDDVPDLPSPHIHSISSLSDDHHDGHSNSSQASEDINLHEDWSEGSNDEERRHGMWEEDDIDLNHDSDSDEGSEDGQRIPEFVEERNHMQVPNGNDAISSDGSDLTKMDSLLAVLAYALKHHLTGEALQDLIHLINLHCPQSLPQSKYLFNKVLNNYKDTCEFHFYCDCFNYLGKIGQLPERCDYCGEHVDHEIKIKEGKFFLTMSLAQQLKYLLESTAVGTTVLNRVIETGDSISDITDGELYQELVTSGLLSNPNNLSLTWNTDGVPVFKSSRSSMWRILCLINELPQKMRSENIILTALWFGGKKPDMSVFLKPFVDESNILSSTGLKWTHIGEEKTSRVFPLVCSVDSVARPALQNFVQFNGFYGCSFCKQKGTYAEGAMKYPYVDPPAEKRTPGETMRQSILAAESGRSIEGVKGC
ncbi:uncharacterized protein LOC121412416 [Lytechinus variegatus]|uniref:uncharacterized protein LOC121412416 n=1 Tax=Lytechinus variegatus TaxID=7654 RepID=UPI001BB23719|nr:uncharacterized protein LOC121412416 [Lytechinus variegatus]